MASRQQQQHTLLPQIGGGVGGHGRETCPLAVFSKA